MTLPSTSDYFEYQQSIWNAVIDLLRADPVLMNYQFKSIEIVGEDFIPEVSGMPAIKLIPDDDTIVRSQTNSRFHNFSFGLFVFEHKGDMSEQAFLDHQQLTGRVYDILMDVDNRQLGLEGVMESEVVSVRVRFVGAEQGINYVSLLQMRVRAEKQE